MGMAESTRAAIFRRSIAFCSASAFMHGGEHAHVVGGGAVHALGSAGEPAEDVASAHHHRDLIAAGDRFGDVAGQPVDDGDVDAIAVAAHQGLPGQLQEHPLVAELARARRPTCRHGRRLLACRLQRSAGRPAPTGRSS